MPPAAVPNSLKELLKQNMSDCKIGGSIHCTYDIKFGGNCVEASIYGSNSHLQDFETKVLQARDENNSFLWSYVANYKTDIPVKQIVDNPAFKGVGDVAIDGRKVTCGTSYDSNNHTNNRISKDVYIKLTCDKVSVAHTK